MIVYANYASAVAAILAAVFWLISSFIPIPKIIDSSIDGPGSIDSALRKQSRWSAVAAVCAAFAALAQAAALWPLPEARNPYEEILRTQDLALGQRALPTTEPPVTISPDALLSEYRDNQVAAESRYFNRMIEMSGEIVGIERNDRQLAYLRLRVDSKTLSVPPIGAFFDREHEGDLLTLKRGQQVTIRCASPEYFKSSGLLLLQACRVAH